MKRKIETGLVYLRLDEEVVNITFYKIVKNSHIQITVPDSQKAELKSDREVLWFTEY